MISKKILVCALAIIVLTALCMPGTVIADPVEEAKQLQDAGDIDGAYSLLQKASTDLNAQLKKNKSDLKTQVSALSKVSSQEQMDEIKKKNDVLLGAS